MFKPKFVLLTLAMLLVFASIMSSNSTTQAASVSATVPAGDAPSAVAVNHVTNMIYVVNQDSDNVTVIDGGDNSTNTDVAVGDEPGAVAVNPETNKVYVTNELSGNVTVIDGNDNSTSTVTVGTGPVAVAVNSETNKVYVANATSGTLTVIDGGDNGTATVTVGGLPGAVAVNPETNRVYVANRGSDDVTVIDGSDNSIVTTLTVGDQPIAVAVDPMTNQVYVANLFSDNVTAIDGGDNTTTTLTVGDNPTGLAVNSATANVYVANKNSDNVTVINGLDQSQADLSLALSQDTSDGATGVKVGISRVFDPVTGEDAALQIHDFQARLSYDGSCIRVLDVRGDVFDITDLVIGDAIGVATFTGTAPTGVTAPADLGLVLTRLLGSASESCSLTLEVTSLNDMGGNTVEVPSTVAQSLLRGDARSDGNVTIADALFITQYLAGLRMACTEVINNTCLHSVNAASVLQDGAFDKKTIADASFIAQHLVGLRDEVYDLNSVAFDLNEENSSGQSGQVALTRRDDQTEVVLSLSAGTLESELVHIHSGQCGPALGGVVHPLTPFVGGSGESVTTVNAPLSSFLTGDFAVNTHKKGDSSVFTACGNIPAAH